MIFKFIKVVSFVFLFVSVRCGSTVSTSEPVTSAADTFKLNTEGYAPTQEELIKKYKVKQRRTDFEKTGSWGFSNYDTTGLLIEFEYHDEKYKQDVRSTIRYELNQKGDILKKTKTEYKKDGKPDPLGETVSTYQYNEDGNILKITEIKSNNNQDSTISQYQYDDQGREVRFTRSSKYNSEMSEFEYDQYGNIQTKVVDNQKTTILYNELDLVEKEITYSRTGEVYTTTTYEYNTRGDCTKVETAGAVSGTTKRTFNTNGQMLTRKVSSSFGSSDITQSYDSRGLLVKKITNGMSGYETKVCTYTFH